jgi:tRNA(Ile)-lysidine synthase
MIRLPKNLLSKTETYHVAVSMGIDSLSALFWLSNEGFKVKAIHVNHGLRSQNDEMQDSFVRTCKAWKIDYETQRVSCDGTEAGCRSARLAAFSKMASGGTIITAHHLNDWVESYLMNCLRGNPERRPFEVLTDFGSFRVIHPFLLTRKADFQQYIERNMMMKLFVEDETNFVTKGSRRNWVRNDLIPSLRGQDISLEKYAKRCVGSLYDEYIDNKRKEN